MQEEMGVTCVEGMRNAYKVWSVNVKGRDHLGDIMVDWRIISKRMLKEQSLRV
jgi:hypothetical protein